MAAPANIIRPPGPPHRPFLGHLFSFRRDAPEFLFDAGARYGDIVYFRLGPQHIYLLNHPDYVKEVLVTQQSKFIKSRILQRSKILLGEGLLTSEGDLHLRQRRLVQPAFHRDRLAGYGATMIACATRAGDRWRPGETLDVAHEMTRLTLAIVAQTLFSADVEAEAAEIGQAMTDILGLFNMLVMPFSELLQKLPLPAIRRFERARGRLDATIYKIIHERRASGEDRGDLLSMLLLAQDEDSSGGMSDRQVRDEALTLFLAGHETTSNALTWTWYLLSQHPEAEERMRAELRRVLGGRPPTAGDLPLLTDTGRIFSEALRLYPPAWAIGRMAAVDCEVAGYTIPAGSILLASPYVMHRDPRYFPDPHRFDMDRWTPEEAAKLPKFAYFPFGGGARTCIGDRFASMEGVLLLATLAQRWRLKLVPGHPVAHRAVITLRTKHGMKMTVHSATAPGETHPPNSIAAAHPDSPPSR
ncbi:MAG: cytochrome P450 [Bryobacteraceae bacterium]